MGFINWFFHGTEQCSSHWDWLHFTSSAYTFHLHVIELDTSYDPNGPQAQAIDVGNFKCLDTLSLSFPTLVFFSSFCKIRNQWAVQGSDLVGIWNRLFLEIMKAVWDMTGAPTWVSCYWGGRPKEVALIMSSKAIFWRLCPCEVGTPPGGWAQCHCNRWDKV